MDVLTHILVSIAGGAAAQVGGALYNLVKQSLATMIEDAPEEKTLQILAAIGNLSDQEIRRHVEQFAREKKLSESQAEELITILINLAHGTRFHTTHGTLGSSFLRCEHLLDQLLDCALPKRRKGQPVATNGPPDWTLTRFLGMGSFGEVWEAENPGYPEHRAIKFFTSPEAKDWLKAEQQALFHVRAALPAHPNLISFVDVGLAGEPYPYLVLEYANGGSLEDWILSPEKDRPSLQKGEVIAALARGLAQAHFVGITHRDLKPANVLLSRSQNDLVPKIADFGLGRVASAQASKATQTSPAVLAGTFMYLPPEALQPFVKREPTQDDIFAFGVLAYQLLGERLERPPYDFADQLRARAVDSQTIRVIERCLAHPERRYKDATEMEAELDDSLLRTVPIWTPPPECFDVQYLAREYLATKA
jgi:serine/threonine protein kinase